MSGLQLGELCGELVCSHNSWLDMFRCLAQTASNYADGNPDERAAQIAADALANAAREYERNCKLQGVNRRDW
jgi:hypothetical protein